MKSICVKTNNKSFISSLLKNIENCSLERTYYSYHKFKHFDNIIIHYTGLEIDNFISDISSSIASSIINYYENLLALNILKNNYFYFSDIELYKIHELCTEYLLHDDYYYKKSIITSSLFDYFSTNKNVNITGFINFRLNTYIRYIDSIVDLCVNKFLIEKEYQEYINLLKLYISTKPTNYNTLHLIYQKTNSIILDENNNVLNINNEKINTKYLSDVSFNSNDYILDFLLSNIPNKLYVHLLETEDEFTHTLKQIFYDRIKLCTECKLCNLFNTGLKQT